MLDKKIIDKIEKKEGKRIVTGDCQWLAQAINDSTGELIGETTLKRMFGFTNDKDILPRRSTLEILARYLGYPDYEAMAIDLELSDVIISDFALKNALESDTLKIGDTIEIKYLPNRILTLKYVGESRFIIEEIENSRNLMAGDILKITMFEKGFPVYMSEVIRNGKNLGAYEAAKNGGLTSIEVLS